MKVPRFLRKAMAAAMVSYRNGPPNPEIDRSRLNHQRIALVKLDNIGDFVLATSFLHLFKSQTPGADVTLFCRKPVGEIARQQFPEWTVVELPGRRDSLKMIYFDGATRCLLKSQPPFDLLLDLRAFRDMGDSAATSWIPARTKLALENAYPESLSWVVCPAEERIYDRLLPLPDYQDSGVPRDLQNHRLLAEHLFPKLADGRSALPKLAVSQSEKEALARRFSPKLDNPFLLICPGTSSPIKEYPVKPLAIAILQALEKQPMSVVIAGAESDARTTRPLVKELQSATSLVNLSGQLDLPQHVALISLSRAVLSMDSCHAHIAGALDVPAVAILGGGQYGFFAPWGESKKFRWLTNPLPCFGCHWSCIYDRPLCIQDIPPAQIAKNLLEILTESAKAA
jgi:ADP-heptose:LPS heptosyltransferase